MIHMNIGSVGLMILNVVTIPIDLMLLENLCDLFL